MKIDLNKIPNDLSGDSFKNTYQGASKQNKPMTVRDMLVVALTVERLSYDMRGSVVVNEKADTEKFEDFKLAMRISDMKQVDIDLDSGEITRIKKLAHFYPTEMYGTLCMELERKVPEKKDSK